MEINIIDIQGVNTSLLNEYMSQVREILRAIMYIADAYDHASIVVLAQRAVSDVDTIGTIIEKSTQNRKE